MFVCDLLTDPNVFIEEERLYPITMAMFGM
jgi:hypothetical protein